MRLYFQTPSKGTEE